MVTLSTILQFRHLLLGVPVFGRFQLKLRNPLNTQSVSQFKDNYKKRNKLKSLFFTTHQNLITVITLKIIIFALSLVIVQ